VPVVESPAERFERLAADAVEHVEHRWRERLASVEFAVDLVPSMDPDDVTDDEIESAGVPLARILPARGRRKAHIVLYRKPMELRARDVQDLEDLLHDVVVQVVANYLGLDPDVVDPGFSS
jgi:predicted Zn-dependent protease with MMP-like domain